MIGATFILSTAGWRAPDPMDDGRDPFEPHDGGGE